MQLAYEFFLLANLLSLAIGSFLYAVSVIKDIEYVLFSVNRFAQDKKKRLETTLKWFAEFVEEQSATKE